MALPVTDFIVERLLEFDSTFDTGGGIATTALMVNPLSVVLQPLRDELDEIQANQSILSVLEDDAPDDFDEDIVDALASNVFIERKEGDIATGTVRVRFFSPQDVDIGVGLASFLDSGGNRFINVNSVSITSAEMGLNIDGSLYYVDIPVEAEEEGDDGNVDAGGIQSFENEPPNVANVTNLADFSGGVDRETNTELIDRIGVAVTVRALVTGRGIITTMQDNFSTIEEIHPIGFGDPEMQRDIVFNTHIGGNVDVWVKTPDLTEETFDVVSIVADTTRQTKEKSSVVMLSPSPTTYPLRHGGIDRTNFTPTAKSADGFITYIETTDYVLSDSAGTIARVGSGNIFNASGTTGVFSGTNGVQADQKTLKDSAAPWTSVRPGMQLKITSPSSVAGVYSIKTVSASSLTIYGTFPVGSVGTVAWQVDDIVIVEYEYNPVAIDVIESVRSTSRTNFTITDTPLMKLKTIEVLDPTTLQPTGTFLDPTGGYGQGGFGVGAFGVGTAADFVLKVVIPNLRFSADEDNFIDISTSKLGFNLRITYDTATEISSYQTFVDNDQERVETASLKVKHFIPVFVDTTTGGIDYKVKASNTSAKTATEIQTLVEDLIENTTIKTNLELSDIVDLLYNSGADQVDLDFGLTGEIHHTNGDVEFINNTDEGILEIPGNLPTDGTLTDTDKPLSKNIAHFVTGTVVLNRTTA
jgi:uncharacterized phage protein gp47/JayE